MIHGKAEILPASPTQVRGGYQRGCKMVYCVCGYRNYFDTFSWGGHKALRCKNPKCRLLIAQNGTVADTRDDLK